MPYLDHVALAVPQLEPVLARCTALGLGAGPIETFPSEGTREVYLGPDDAPARLLLIQPLHDASPYARALTKRGPGLHHIAFCVADLNTFLPNLQGWLLHPKSIETIAASRTAWLARPGVATLVEVMEHRPHYASPPTIDAIEISSQPALESLLHIEVAGEAIMGLRSGHPSRICIAAQWHAIDPLVTR